MGSVVLRMRYLNYGIEGMRDAGTKPLLLV